MTSSSNQPLPTTLSLSNDKLIIGLTGGIGSGKTVVSNWFINQNIDVVDADVIAHNIMQPNSAVLKEVTESLGDWIINPQTKEMDRAKVREHVFAHPEDLKRLESITHPAIRQHIFEGLTRSTSPYTILSAPLLLESEETGLKAWCNRILVVDVAESTQLQRASLRDTQSIESIRSIMEKQIKRSDRVSQAHDVVNNEGTLETLYSQLRLLHEFYLELAQQK